MAVAEVEDRVTVRTGDLRDHLDELDGDFDLLTLDTGDAPAVVEHAPGLLVHGGYVAVYSPFVESARATVEAARDAGLSDVESTESIERELTVDDRGTRPSTAGVGHTGYLTVARNR
jgi:tRNA (adenine57-N1/adenine58-N1)-methyltransferase